MGDVCSAHARGRAGPVLAMGLLLVAVAAALAGRGWALDLLAGLAAQWLLVAAVAGAWWAVRRRWGCMLGAAAAAAGLLVSLGPIRAPRSGGPANFTALIYNARNDHPDPAGAIDLVLESGADVVALLEPAPAMIESSRHGAIAGTWPHGVFRGWTPGGPNSYQALRSRWPITRPDGRPLDESFEGVIEVIVHAPSGPVGVVVLQPASPRTPARWRIGNDEARQAARAATRLQSARLPVVVMADFNAAPGGHRSRLLRSGPSLVRCKPLWMPVGTWPAWSIWPLTLALDDAMVSPGVTVVSWQALPPAGSDHRPVLVGLAVPSSSSAGGG